MFTAITNSTKPLVKNAMPMYSNVLYIVYPFVIDRTILH